MIIILSLVFTLILSLFFGSSCSHPLNKCLDSACQGSLAESYNCTKHFFINDSDARYSEYLLMVSALEYLLNADVNLSVNLYSIGKKLNQSAIPPLASFHLNGYSCEGMSDIYYVTAVLLRKFYDSSLNSDVILSGHKNMISLLSDSGLHYESEKHLMAALTLDPDDSTLKMRSLFMLPGVYSSLDHVFDVRNLLNQRMTHLHNNPSNPLTKLDEFSLPPSFYLVYQGMNDNIYLSKLDELYSTIHPPLTNIHISPTQLQSSTISTSKIKIGFVSAHFRRHSICKLFCGMILGLDRDIFDVYTFSSLQEPHEDQQTRTLVQSTTFVRIGMTVIANRQEVVRRDIHILVYLDVGMDPSTKAWAASRLAPIQMCTWGHPSTTGLAAMDYYLSSDRFHLKGTPFGTPSVPFSPFPSTHPDSAADTSSSSSSQPRDSSRWLRQINNNPLSTKQHLKTDPQSRFSEQLVLLDDLGFSFARPLLSIHEELKKHPEEIWRRSDKYYELLSNSVDIQAHPGLQALLQLKRLGNDILLCPQHLPKFHPIFDYVLKELLQHHSNTYLVILNPKNKIAWKLTLINRWNNLIGADIVSRRVIWMTSLSPSQYLTLLALGDVMLDPFPFGGGVTTLESLAVSIPVVTLPSLQSVPALASGMITRMSDNIMNIGGDSQLDASQLLILISSSEDDYVKTVTNLLARNQSKTIKSKKLILRDDAENITEIQYLRRLISKYSDVVFDVKESVASWSTMFQTCFRSMMPDIEHSEH